VLVDGKDVSLVGTGQMVHACLEAAKILRKEGISAEVVNMSTIKPLDTATLGKTISRTGCIVTAEEHSIIGGLGSAVAEYISEEGFVPLTRIGTRDTFGESGTPEELFKKYGLTAEDVASAARKSMAKRRRS
ncbi:MAG: transketolase C-terminal domain-containing protein, partial [Candidatus Methanomethylophilaceae archaeon]|nr:transketolase C-terminal domain-containing protein [Candidatus Methanomethylophilaceae archaeon]